MTGGQQHMNNCNKLAEVAQAIVFQQVSSSFEDEFYSDSFNQFKYQELTFRNLIVNYLIDQVRNMQLQNSLMIEGFSEVIDEIQQDVMQAQKYMDFSETQVHEEEKQPASKKLMFQGKEISQDDYNTLLEYTVKNHIESMISIDKRIKVDPVLCKSQRFYRKRKRKGDKCNLAYNFTQSRESLELGGKKTNKKTVEERNTAVQAVLTDQSLKPASNEVKYLLNQSVKTNAPIKAFCKETFN